MKVMIGEMIFKSMNTKEPEKDQKPEKAWNRCTVTALRRTHPCQHVELLAIRAALKHFVMIKPYGLWYFVTVILGHLQVILYQASTALH